MVIVGDVVRHRSGLAGLVTSICPNGHDVRVRTQDGKSRLWSKFERIPNEMALMVEAFDELAITDYSIAAARKFNLISDVIRADSELLTRARVVFQAIRHLAIPPI